MLLKFYHDIAYLVKSIVTRPATARLSRACWSVTSAKKKPGFQPEIVIREGGQRCPPSFLWKKGGTSAALLELNEAKWNLKKWKYEQRFPALLHELNFVVFFLLTPKIRRKWRFLSSFCLLSIRNRWISRSIKQIISSLKNFCHYFCVSAAFQGRFLFSFIISHGLFMCQPPFSISAIIKAQRGTENKKKQSPSKQNQNEKGDYHHEKEHHHHPWRHPRPGHQGFWEAGPYQYIMEVLKN